MLATGLNTTLGSLSATTPGLLAQEFVREWFFSVPASSKADTNDAIFAFIFWVSVFFFLLIIGGAGYFTWKYRRRPGVPQERSPAHHTPLEITWTVAPCFLLLIMFVWGFRGFMNMHVDPARGEEVLLTAYQWNWEATYDNGAGNGADVVNVANKDVPVIRVPHGTPVKLLMTSRDVIHSFYVPDFRVKMDIFPNRYTTTWFEATSVMESHYDENGELLGTWADHELFCAEYCGDGHSQMAAIIRVMPPSDFIEWKAQAANIFAEDKTPSEVGELLYRAKGCNACHAVEPGGQGIGPTWAGVYGSEVPLAEGGTVEADVNYLRESILYPAAKIHRGYPNQMQSYQGLLTDMELFALIQYIKSLSEEGQQELEGEQTYGELGEGEASLDASGE
jgi:cytochrome c oxidase subunit 2